MTPPPSPTTNECRSRCAAIISSQIAPACSRVLDFSPAAIVMRVGRKPAASKLFSTRSAKSGATFESEMSVQGSGRPSVWQQFPMMLEMPSPICTPVGPVRNLAAGTGSSTWLGPNVFGLPGSKVCLGTSPQLNSDQKTNPQRGDRKTKRLFVERCREFPLYWPERHPPSSPVW